MLNWYCVIPTSRRKKSVMALPLLAGQRAIRISNMTATASAMEGGPKTETYMFPLSSCSAKKPRIKSGMTNMSVLSGARHMLARPLMAATLRHDMPPNQGLLLGFSPGDILTAAVIVAVAELTFRQGDLLLVGHGLRVGRV